MLSLIITYSSLSVHLSVLAKYVPLSDISAPFILYEPGLIDVGLTRFVVMTFKRSFRYGHGDSQPLNLQRLHGSRNYIYKSIVCFI